MSSTELAHRVEHLNGRAWIELMGPALELARNVVDTAFVPRSIRGNGAAIVAAILYGDELGLGPMQSLSKISVIDGKPSLSSEAQRALILAAGHEIWTEEATNTRVTVSGRRAGSERTSSVTWTSDDAKRAGLSGKPSYRSYPRQMLTARASAELARMLFADVIGGLSATEELETAAEEEAVVEEQPKRRRRRTSTSSPETTARASGPVEVGPPEPEEPPLPDEPLEPDRPENPADIPATPATPDETREPEPDSEPGTGTETPEGFPATPATPEPEEPGAVIDVAARALAVAEEPELITDLQRAKLQALMRELDVTDRKARLSYCRQIIGHELSSSNELTLAEAGRVIDALELWKANPEGGPFQPPYDIPY